MGSVIYETINFYNKDNGILPYRYIGSDQYNNPKYFGSNKELKKDIEQIGKEYFEKRIIFEFSENISNLLLRKIESDIQKKLDVAHNIEYYNKTNSSLKGYIETDEQKKIRIKKSSTSYKKWWDSLSEEDKNKYKEKANKGYRYWWDSLSEEDKIKHKEKCRKGVRVDSNRGVKNGKSKQIIDIDTGKEFDTMLEAMSYYGIKKYDTIRSWIRKEKKVKYS
jgi:hypothetical protein